MEKQAHGPGGASPLHGRIEERRVALGLSKEAVGVRAGLDKSYLKKLLSRPGSVPAADTLERLAQVLGCTPEWLLGRTGAPQPEAPPQMPRPRGEPAPLPVHSPAPPASGPVPNLLPDLLRGDVRIADIEAPATGNLPSDVPVYGTVAGSFVRGAFQFEGGVIEFVRRPPAMFGSKGVYALYVEGESMAPEHKPGDLRFVHTTRPPRVGDSVVVQVQAHADGEIEGYIGHYLRQTPTKLVIGKLNPKAEVELKREYVRAVHKVLTVNELFGI